VLSEGLAVSLFLALRQSRPLFLEGEAGVGKTEVAKTLAALLDRRLIRLQCYEGLDINAAAYEWNYARQMMQIQSAGQGKLESADLFTEDNLIERPLLEALREDARGAPVLLIDELDRADEAFEAYLLEILSDWQITIPEFGTVAAATPPIVIVTSNRTREIHDALKRRCFYHWVDYPSLDDELDILKRKAPEAGPELSQQVLRFVHRLREMKLFKAPGVAETIDWAHALVELDCLAVDPATADTTLGVLLKYQDDISKIRGTEAARILAQVQTEILG
jgi:MoxR-like ATPase